MTEAVDAQQTRVEPSYLDHCTLLIIAAHAKRTELGRAHEGGNTTKKRQKNAGQGPESCESHGQHHCSIVFPTLPPLARSLLQEKQPARSFEEDTSVGAWPHILLSEIYLPARSRKKLLLDAYLPSENEDAAATNSKSGQRAPPEMATKFQNFTSPGSPTIFMPPAGRDQKSMSESSSSSSTNPSATSTSPKLLAATS